MTDPVGPIWSGGFEEVTVSAAGVSYVLQFLPEKHNDRLQDEGKAPVYYWLMNGVRLAQKQNGDLKFFMLHYAGVQSGDVNIGVAPGQVRESSGGALSFTVTTAPPDAVLKAAHDQILDRFKDRGNKFWSFRSASPRPASGDPVYLRPVPVRGCTTTVSNASMNDDGALTTGGGMDPFFWKCQGQGPGAVSPLAENSYTVMMGSTSAALVAASLKGNQSLINVYENLTLPLWAPVDSLSMTADWDRVFSHFNVAANAKYFWAEADVKATFNTLRLNGAITVDLEIDKTIPGADDKEAMIDKYIDLLISQWMEQAKQVIFQPMPEVKDPEPNTSGGVPCLFGWGFGVGVSLNYRHDHVHLHNSFQFNIDEMYLQPHSISGPLDGIADITAKDPSALRKYFAELYLDDLDRKITTTCTPVVNWPDPGKGWHGDPVNSVSVEVGYPNTNGSINWSGTAFNRPPDPETVPGPDLSAGNAALPPTTADKPTASAFITYGAGTSSAQWFARNTMKKPEDVPNPPSGWTPDQVFVKRAIHFAEPPAENEDPNLRIFVEVNDVDLDPPRGTLTTDLEVPVRVDHVGTLNVGPIHLAIAIARDNDVVEVSFQSYGNTLAGTPRPITKFEFTKADLRQDRYWAIYTGQPDYQPKFRYQVRYLREGTVDEDGEEWLGPWTDAEGNGPLNVHVPRKTDAGVTVVS
jgi:hypothetical protein